MQTTDTQSVYAATAQALNRNLPRGGVGRGRRIAGKTVKTVEELRSGYWVTWADGAVTVVRYADCA